MAAVNSHSDLAWQLRAQMGEFRRHVDGARRLTEEALTECIGARFVLSWSGGKDSTAMVHLVRSIDPTIPIMIQFDDCDWPEKRPYVECVAEQQGWQYHTVEPSFSVFEAASKGRIGFDQFCAQSHWLTKDSFLKPLDKMRCKLGAGGVFLGLRAEESRARSIHLWSRGGVYRLKNGQWRCCPLMRWTAEDVFAYLTKHGIEINPCYLNNRFQPPENIRLSWALPTPTGIRYGDMQHIRYYYPEQFRRLRDLGVI